MKRSRKLTTLLFFAFAFITGETVSTHKNQVIKASAVELLYYKADFADFSVRTGSMSNYTAEQTIQMKYGDDMTLEWIARAGNAYNESEGGTRFGGNNSAPLNSELANLPDGIDSNLRQLWLKTNEQIAESITKIEVVTKANFGTASHTSGGTRKTFLQVSANADFSNSQEYNLPTELNHKHVFTPETPWAKDMYYRILWEKHGVSGNSGIIINSVNFYHEVESEILPNEINLNVNSVSLEEEESAQLTATILPLDANDKSVVWSSDDESIATVDQTGLVMGIEAGTTTIHVATIKGSGSASATVTVTPGPLYKDNTVNFDGWVSGYDAHSLTSKGLEWEVNIGQRRSSVSYFGSNSTQTNIDQMKAVGIFSAFSGFPHDDYSNIAIMYLKNKAIQGLIHFGANWTTVEGNGLIGLALSNDGGGSFYKVGTEEEIVDNGSIALNESVQDDVLVAVYLLSSAHVNIRNMAIRLEGTEFVVPNVLPLSVSISGPNEVYTGQTIKLIAEVLPGAASQTVTWESLHPAIATVANGNVTGVKKGTATIKATTVNGKTDTFEVVVNEAPTYAFTLGGKTDYYDHLLGGSEGKLYWEFAAQGDGELYAGGNAANGGQFGKSGVPLDELRVTSELIVLGSYNKVERLAVEVRGVDTFMAVHFIDFVGNRTLVEEDIALNNDLVVYEFDISAVDMEHHVGRIELTFTGMTAAMYIKTLELWLARINDPDLNEALEFANKLEKYKTCSEFTEALEDLGDDYDALSNGALDYLDEIMLRDFKSDEYAIQFGRDTYVSAAHKWAYIKFMEDNKGETDDAYISAPSNPVNATLIIGLLGLTTIAGYYFLSRKEKRHL